nr:hypothetical protein [Caldilineaceae bacterium]
MGIRRNWIYTWRWLLILGLLVTFAPGPALQAQGSSILALVRGKGATLYAQPEGEVVQTLAPGDRLDATGRTQDALWIIGKSADGVAGWLRAEDVIIYDLLTLPVVESMAAPVAQPAPAPA